MLAIVTSTSGKTAIMCDKEKGGILKFNHITSMFIWAYTEIQMTGYITSMFGCGWLMQSKQK